MSHINLTQRPTRMPLEIGTNNIKYQVSIGYLKAPPWCSTNKCLSSLTSPRSPPAAAAAQTPRLHPSGFLAKPTMPPKERPYPAMETIRPDRVSPFGIHLSQDRSRFKPPWYVDLPGRPFCSSSRLALSGFPDAIGSWQPYGIAFVLAWSPMFLPDSLTQKCHNHLVTKDGVRPHDYLPPTPYIFTIFKKKHTHNKICSHFHGSSHRVFYRFIQ